MRAPGEYRPQVSTAPLARERPQARLTDATPLAAAGVRAGATMGGIADRWSDEDDRAAAKDADAAFATAVRTTLYDADNGYLFTSGSNAVTRRQEVADALSKARTTAVNGLTPGAARYADEVLRRRMEQALGAVDRHTATQREAWLASAGEARIASAVSDAAFAASDPLALGMQAIIAEGEVLDAAERAGWPEEETAAKLTTARTQVYGAAIRSLATSDPVAAEALLEEHAKRMDGAEVTRLRAALSGVAKERRGREAGAAAFRGRQPLAATDLPSEAQAFLNLIAGPESGGRYDVRFDGSPTGATITDFSDHPRVFEDIPEGFAAAGSRSSAAGRYQFIGETWDRAAKALGLEDFSPANQDRAAWWLAQDDYRKRTGRELLGDLRDPARATAVRDALTATWEGLGKVDPDDMAAAMRGGGAADLLAIEDPDERDAALAEFALRQKLTAAQASAAHDAAAQAAFAFIEAGGGVEAIPLEHREMLGREEMNALRSYAGKIAEGVPVKTDEEVWYGLRNLAATRPEEFAAANLFVHRASLSDKDFRALSDLQNKTLGDMAGAKRKAASLSGVMGLANDRLRLAGVETRDAKMSDEDRRRVVAFEGRMLDEMEAFIAREDREPSDAEKLGIVDRLLAEVVVSGGGTVFPAPGLGSLGLTIGGGGERLRIFEADTLDLGDDGFVEVGGERLDQSEMAVIRDAYRARYGVEPGLDEIVDIFRRGRGL